MTVRPFRFGVQAFEATSAQEWFDTVAMAEDLGYSTLFSSDHYFGPGAISEATGHRPVDLAPLSSIAVAAARTSTLRVGCRVFACDFHHPVVLAKEMATLDLLSEGRLEVGLGAGWVADEYEGLGVPMERPGIRIAKVAAYAEAMRAHWSGEQLDLDDGVVTAKGFSGLPLPATPGGPPIMIGGGAPRILGVAGRHADIVSLNFNNSSGRLGGASVASSGADETAEKIGWIRDGAGERFDDIELEIGAYFVAVGDDADAQLEAMAARFGVSADEFASHPHALFGTPEQICETLIARRETYGVSYVTVAQRTMQDLAPVVATLAGA
ncbi:MAG: TIGR03621 family F420-dependent LLM class oxidoreductase [Acidimicrobiales bacterium]